MIQDRVLIRAVGGQCPVQAHGWVAGERFEFRARGAQWRIEIGDWNWSEPAWRHEEAYGAGHEAGYMPPDVAEAFIRRECARFIAAGHVAAAETPSWRELDMGRFGPGPHGPLRAVTLEVLRDGGAFYRAALKGERRFLDLGLDHVAPTEAQRVEAPGLVRIERWTLNDRGLGLWKDDGLKLAIRLELEASAARLGLAVLTEIAMSEA